MRADIQNYVYYSQDGSAEYLESPPAHRQVATARGYGARHGNQRSLRHAEERAAITKHRDVVRSALLGGKAGCDRHAASLETVDRVIGTRCRKDLPACTYILIVS